MTHDERIAYLNGIPEETISPKQLAAVIGGNPYGFNLSAKAGKLKIPHEWRGRNLRIYKEPLLRLIEHGEFTVSDAICPGSFTILYN